MAAPLSLRAYARRRGVSPEAVSKAIMSGRLRACVVQVNGQPKIGDAEIADREWEANTQPRIDYPPPTAVRQGADDEEREGLPPGVPPYDISRAVREFHAARREGALADVAEIERDEKRDELVPVDEARAYMIEKFTIVKTKILGVPSAVGQKLPHLALEVMPVVDSLLRSVLEELAAEGIDGDGEEDAEEE